MRQKGVVPQFEFITFAFRIRKYVMLHLYLLPPLINFVRLRARTHTRSLSLPQKTSTPKSQVTVQRFCAEPLLLKRQCRFFNPFMYFKYLSSAFCTCARVRSFSLHICACAFSFSHTHKTVDAPQAGAKQHTATEQRGEVDSTILSVLQKNSFASRTHYLILSSDLKSKRMFRQHEPSRAHSQPVNSNP